MARKPLKEIMGLILCLSLALILSAPAMGQYPTKPINFVLGFAAGGTATNVTRPFCDAAGKILGQPIVILNKPGGSTSVSLVYLKNEKPDGYSLGYLTTSSILMPHWGGISYDVTQDFTYIIRYIEFLLNGIVCQAESPWKTLPDMLAYAKANPGKVKYSTPGPGSIHYLTMESLAKEAGVKWTHIPSKGGAEALTNLLGGHLDFVASTAEWKPYVQSGRLRIIGQYARKRSVIYPEVPTLLDLGFKTYAGGFSGVVGPKGIPQPIVNQLHDAFKKALDDPDFNRMVKNADLEVSYGSPERLAQDVKEFNEYCRKWVNEFGEKK